MASNIPVDNTGGDNEQHTLPSLENLSLSNESLIRQVGLAKQELDHHFQRYHRNLYDKEQQMVSQLDAIMLSANDLYKKKRELIQTQSELEKMVSRNEFHDMKARMLDPLLIEMSELERSISRSEREVVELEWKDSQLEAAIKESCVVFQRDPVDVSTSTPATHIGISYEDMQVPVWSVGSEGSGDGQFNTASGLAIDPENENIYVSDYYNNRIAIFNIDGDFRRNLKIDKLENPYAIIVSSEVLYVTCNLNNGLILKVNKRNGNVLATLKPGKCLVAITLDKETGMLFGCPLNVFLIFDAPSIWHIRQDDLKKISSVKLQAVDFTSGETQLYVIEIRKEEIFILFRNSPSPFQSFSRDGKLLRNMIIPTYMIAQSLFMTIDDNDNFIFSDTGAHKIKIFSPTGERIAIIGKEITLTEEPGELYGPRGIALTSNGNIVVCDGKTKNILQMF